MPVDSGPGGMGTWPATLCPRLGLFPEDGLIRDLQMSVGGSGENVGSLSDSPRGAAIAHVWMNSTDQPGDDNWIVPTNPVRPAGSADLGHLVDRLRCGLGALSLNAFSGRASPRRTVQLRKFETFLCPFSRRAADFTRTLSRLSTRTKSSSFMDRKASRRFESHPESDSTLRIQVKWRSTRSPSVVNLEIDVEQLRDLDDPESIARRFFSTAEVSELLSLQPDDRGLAFFRCWTRKEAYIKAIGDGLAIPLNHFQVTLRPGSSGPVCRGGQRDGNCRRLDAS